MVWALLLVGTAAMAQKTSKKSDLRIQLPNVQFAAEKSAIRAEAAAELDELVALLKKNTAVSVDIGTHTDASGSASYNLRLSQQRAQSISSYLVKKGVSIKRFKAKGYGETRPINRCRRGVRCSDAEKRENRRVELRITGIPDNPEAQRPWLILGGQAPKMTSPVTAKIVSPPAETYKASLTNAGASMPVPETAVGAGSLQTDFFPELTESQQAVPQPLPNTFIGYTIEIMCTDKPLAAGHSALRKYDGIYLRQEAGGRYCYFIGAFTTMSEAQQFMQKEALPKFPKAQIVAFANNEKKYFNR